MLVAQYSTYKRHRPEQTLLYQLVESHYPEFIKQLSDQGKSLPRHVEKEFAEFLKCGGLEHGFLLVIWFVTTANMRSWSRSVAKAGVFADTHQSDKLERLCRYIARPAVSKKNA